MDDCAAEAAEAASGAGDAVLPDGAFSPAFGFGDFTGLCEAAAERRDEASLFASLFCVPAASVRAGAKAGAGATAGGGAMASGCAVGTGAG